MYAENHGPFGWNGESTVSVFVDAKFAQSSMVYHSQYDYALAVAVYNPDRVSITNVCDTTFDPDNTFARVQITNRTTTDHPSNVSFKFHVREEGLQRVLIQTCERMKSFPQGNDHNASADDNKMPYSQVLVGDPVFNIHAKLELLNPYGYLPGTLYGLLPFSGCLALAYLAADAVFIGLFVIYRKSIIRVQYFILVVLVMATLETIFWYASYRDMNQTGKAVCCPYPPLFLVWTVLKVFSEGLARSLLLLVSIGYGVR